MVTETPSIQRLLAAPGSIMRGLADGSQEGSFSNRSRERRFAPFAQLVDDLHAELGLPVNILDIGGTNGFWEQRGWHRRSDVRIVAANLMEEPRRHENIEPRVADATDLADLADDSFDIVFSNSVIEHLQTWGAQRAMAREVRRLSSRYWVQTPNYWFPVEPHFLTPAWHWLPEELRVALLRRRRWGWRGPCPDPHQARKLVQEIRLLRRREMRELFPGARLIEESFGPLVKSFVAFRA